MATEKKYFAYINDDVEEVQIEDLGEFYTFGGALDLIITKMMRSEHLRSHTFRVVELATSTTVWIAGPGNQITGPLETGDDWLAARAAQRRRAHV